MFPPRRKDRKVPEFQSCAPEVSLGAENQLSFFSITPETKRTQVGGESPGTRSGVKGARSCPDKPNFTAVSGEHSNATGDFC